MKKISKLNILEFGPCKDISNIGPNEFNWNAIELLENLNIDPEDLIWVCFRKEVIGEDLLAEYVLKVFSEKYPNETKVISILNNFKENKQPISKEHVLDNFEKKPPAWNVEFLLLSYWITPERFYSASPAAVSSIPLNMTLIREKLGLNKEVQNLKEFLIKNKERLP